MAVASYNIGSFSIRYRGPDSEEYSLTLPSVPKYYGKVAPTLSCVRLLDCLKLLPQKLDALVISNGGLTSLDAVKVMVDIGRCYAKKVVVILPTLARILAAMNGVGWKDVPAGGHVLLVSLMTDKVELITIQRQNNNTLVPVERSFVSKRDVIYEAEVIADRIRPFVVLINYEERVDVSQILPQFPLRKLCSFDKFFPLLTRGSIEMASSVIGKSYWNIVNFSAGIDASHAMSRQPLEHVVPFGAVFPFTVKQIHYHTTFALRRGMEMVCRHETVYAEGDDCFLRHMFHPITVDKVIVVFDENGVPHPGEIDGLFTFTFDMGGLGEAASLEDSSKVTTHPGNQASDDLFGRQTRAEKNLPLTNPVIILKESGYIGVQVNRGSRTEMLLNDDEEEWIPLFISLRTGTSVCGQVAVQDLKLNSEYVIYDMLKIIGKTYQEIERDPSWGFQLEPTETGVLFIAKSKSGIKRVTPELAIAIPLKAMRLFAESKLGPIEDDEIRVKTDFKLNNKQKLVIRNACQKTGLIFCQ